MREIKFRGRYKDGKWWVYGSLDYRPELNVCQILYATLVDHDGVDYCDEFVDVDPDTVGEFTGLKDKNGKEIYEGDVVQYTAQISSSRTRASVIAWDDKLAGFYENGSQLHRPNLYQVIGNIHENPELLK